MLRISNFVEVARMSLR